MNRPTLLIISPSRMRLPGLASSRRPPQKALRTPLGSYCHSDRSLHTPSGEQEFRPAHSLALPTCPAPARQLCRPVLCTSPACHLPGPPTASLAVRGGGPRCSIKQQNKVRRMVPLGLVPAKQHEDGFWCAGHLLFLIWVFVTWCVRLKKIHEAE